LHLIFGNLGVTFAWAAGATFALGEICATCRFSTIALHVFSALGRQKSFFCEDTIPLASEG